MDPHHFRKPDPDSDPQQRDADPQHCLQYCTIHRDFIYKLILHNTLPKQSLKALKKKKIIFVEKVMCHCTYSTNCDSHFVLSQQKRY
jgi:hypothetical protein